MLSQAVQGMVPTKLVNTVSAANTAAATSAWVAVPVTWEGDVQFLQVIGAVTGSITGAVQTADDGSGTGARTVTFSDGTTAFTAVSSSNNAAAKTVDRKALGTHVQYTGTIVTGPALTAVMMQGTPKYL